MLLDMEVRERLRDLIKSRMGNNQSELARRIGEHPNWVNYRLTGTTAIKADELPRLAAGLGVSPCAFFEQVSPPSRGGLVRMGDIVDDPNYVEVPQEARRQIYDTEELTELDTIQQVAAELSADPTDELAEMRLDRLIKRRQERRHRELGEASGAQTPDFEDAPKPSPNYAPTLGDWAGKDLVDVMRGMSPKRAALLLGMLKLMEEAEIE